MNAMLRFFCDCGVNGVRVNDKIKLFIIREYELLDSAVHWASKRLAVY